MEQNGSSARERWLAGAVVWFSLLLGASPSLAGGVAILETVVTDNGDGDGFADTNETASLRLRVENTSGVALSNVSITLRADRPQYACLTDPTIQVGHLAVGEERLTSDAFVFKVSAGADRTLLGRTQFEELSVSFVVLVASNPPGQSADPSKISLDLDLDVSGGAGSTTFFESFESGMGAFAVQNLDQGLDQPAESDGYRCQYNNPDWVHSNDPAPTLFACYLGVPAGHADAVFWNLSGPETSPGGGRGFSGFHSLFWGVDLGPPQNWTTPVSVFEAVRTAAPIAIGWQGSSPVLSIKHQASMADYRAFKLPTGTTYDRGVVMAQVADNQGNPAGPWIKLYAHQNNYDEVHLQTALPCSFDPVDDGSDEDDFYDPSDPQRRYGPSSTCYPEPIFGFIGETSNPFAPENVGRADGPGLQGLWGIGTWIESEFDLSRFRGRRIRLRFLASALMGPPNTDWADRYPLLNPDPGDDGWWIDDVSVTGTLVIPATVAVDTRANSSLPGGLPDMDADGIHDSCDNCAAQANTEQYDRDFDGIGNVCDFCINDPSNLDDDGDSVCNLLDNCPQIPNASQTDADEDEAGAVCDCNDGYAWTYPGAVEFNDGQDNQCPGDAGYGVADEISNTLNLGPADDQLSWAPQGGATRYGVVRSGTPVFAGGCTSFRVGAANVVDPARPPVGGVFYYLVRTHAPHVGSWGVRSNGQERILPCN